MNRVHYSVSGLSNHECKTKVKNALVKVDGISQTAVDLARASVEVGYNKPANECKIKDCIEKTGYRVL